MKRKGTTLTIDRNDLSLEYHEYLRRADVSLNMVRPHVWQAIQQADTVVYRDEIGWVTLKSRSGALPLGPTDHSPLETRTNEHP